MEFLILKDGLGSIEVNIEGEEYIVRSLREEELISWTEFCADAFSAKANPPLATYFHNHFINDPDSDINFIFVAMLASTQEIASTLRLFRRRFFQGDDETDLYPIPIVGIGEVCTKKKFRRKGLSSLLLTHALQVAFAQQYEYALLHSSSGIQTFYKKFGFVSSSCEWTSLTLRVDSLRGWAEEKQVVVEELVRVITIHEHVIDISELVANGKKRRGIIFRSKEYIELWIAEESKNSLSVGLFQGTSLKGYLSLQSRGSNAFRVSDGWVSEDPEEYWKLLLKGLIEISKESASEESVKVMVPTKFLEDYAIFEDRIVKSKTDPSLTLFPNIMFEAAIDDGWMIASMLKSGRHLRGRPMTVELLWPIDSF